MSVTKNKKLLEEEKKNTGVCKILFTLLLVLLVLVNTLFIFFLWSRVDILIERLSEQQKFSE